MFRERERINIKNDRRILAQTFEPIAKVHLSRAKKQPDEIRKILERIKEDREHYKLNTSRPYNTVLGVLEVSTELTGFAESFIHSQRVTQEGQAKGIILIEASFGIQAVAAVLSSSEDLVQGFKNAYLEEIHIPEVLSGLTVVPTLRLSTLTYLKLTENKRKEAFTQDKTGSGKKVIADFVSFVKKNFGTPGFRAGAEFAQQYYHVLYPLTA